QPGDAQVVVGDDLALGVEHLAHFHGDLRFLEAGGQVLDVVDGGADAHHRLDVVLARKGVHNGGGQLFHIAGAVVRLDLLDQHGVGLADVKDKVLLLVREQAADHVVGRDIVGAGNTDQQHHPLHVRDKMQLPRLGVDIAGQDIVQHDIFDKIGL